MIVIAGEDEVTFVGEEEADGGAPSSSPANSSATGGVDRGSSGSSANGTQAQQQSPAHRDTDAAGASASASAAEREGPESSSPSGAPPKSPLSADERKLRKEEIKRKIHEQLRQETRQRSLPEQGTGGHASP